MLVTVRRLASSTNADIVGGVHIYDPNSIISCGQLGEDRVSPEVDSIFVIYIRYRTAGTRE